MPESLASPGVKVAILSVAVVVATAVIVVVPSLGAGVGLAVAVALVIASVVHARAGRVLNAAWVIILAVYLLDPGGIAFVALGSPVPMVVAIAIVPVPFIITALGLHPDTRSRLFVLLPLVALTLLALLSLAWSPDPGYGLRKLTQWIVAGLLPCVAVLVLASPTRPVQWRWIVAAALVYAVVLLLIGNTTLYPGRISFFEANPIWVARAVFVGALVTAFGPFPNAAKVVLMPLMLVAGYLTDSLGPGVGLVLGLAAGGAEMIRVADISRRRSRLALAGVAVVAALGVTTVFATLSSTETSSVSQIVNDPNITSRASYLGLAGQMFANAPIFGSGFGGFAAANAVDLYPHNLFAEIASELGLVGLGLLLAWLILALRGAAGSPLLVALVVATTAFSLFSGNIAGNVEFWIFTGVAVAMTPLRQWAGSTTMVPAT